MIDLSRAYPHIRDYIELQMDRFQIPGLALAVTDRDQLLHIATYGYANLDAREPVTPDHLFETGSIGKSFTAIALLQLQEEGEIDLQMPVTAYLPWFEVQSGYEPITMHHLLSMTAGITSGSDFPADKRFEIWALRETSTAWPPGERFHYSNLGYKALGVVLERIEGKPYAEIIRERILNPLGMTQTDPTITHETRKKLVAGHRYFYDDRPWLPRHGLVPATWLETDTGDGCIASTPADLAIYLRELLNGGQRLLSRASFEAMTSQIIERSAGRWYGYGLASSGSGSQMLIGHGGSMVGYYAHMLGDLETGLGVTVMINGSGNAEEIAFFALQALQAAANSSTLPDLPPVPDRKTIEDAASYAGEYYPLGPSSHSSLTFTVEGKQLMLAISGENLPVLHLRGDLFLVDHPEFWLVPFRFDRDSGRLYHGGDCYQRGIDERLHIVVEPAELDPRAGHYRSHNPWASNFRIVDRLGTLAMIWPSGAEDELVQIGKDCFRVGDTPETISFDTFVDGQALRATHSCCPFYRFFTD